MAPQKQPTPAAEQRPPPPLIELRKKNTEERQLCVSGREGNKSRSTSENEKKSIKVRSGTQKEIENVETSWQEAKANVCSVCLFIAKDRRDPHGSAVQPSLWGFLLSPSFYHPFGLPFAMLPFAQCRA
ncbi:hypothetical protein RUM43_007954 [Polyplax serrata]|uniref:Uncharacterized protein n=1 Tax=Polyplax serrata TaxID=468196 RepID=A0AAN8PN61_POLSC